MKDRDKIVFEKIIKYIDKIENRMIGVSFDKFSDANNDEALVYCAFSMLQIWELAKKIPKAEWTNYPTIPWNQIRGMPNRITHEYDDIDHYIVWDTIHESLPQLRDVLLELLETKNTIEGAYDSDDGNTDEIILYLNPQSLYTVEDNFYSVFLFKEVFLKNSFCQTVTEAIYLL